MAHNRGEGAEHADSAGGEGSTTVNETKSHAVGDGGGGGAKASQGDIGGLPVPPSSPPPSPSPREGKVTVTTSKGKITCNRVIVAANGWMLV